MSEELKPCGQCGMFCGPGEYHPFAACLMFFGCGSADTVRRNLVVLPKNRTEPEYKYATRVDAVWINTKNTELCTLADDIFNAARERK